MPASSPTTSRLPALRKLADEVLETSDLGSLAHLLTRSLPQALGLQEASLLLWNRRVDRFQAFSSSQTQTGPLAPAEATSPPPTRWLISEGALVETPGGQGEGVLLPLMARTGLVGVLVVAGRRERRRVPFRPSEARLLWVLARRSALAVENHLYQAELIASERMAALGTMAGMLAHDFRGPLTVIRGYAELIQQGQASPQDVRGRATLIMEMIDRLERMTSETLDFAREGGRLARRPAPLALFLEEVAKGLEEEFPGLEVHRDFHLPAGATAEVDADKLRRALGNLGANARDAMGGHGRLHLRAELSADPDRLVLVVADEGPGVAADIRDRLFEPFVSLGKKRGTGLGLAVARRFIEDHGGSVELMKEGPGARFRIALPLRSPANAVVESR